MKRKKMAKKSFSVFGGPACDKSTETDVLKNILPLNSILSKFSVLDIRL